MKSASIALGFANTVDYQIAWDSSHLERLILKSGLRSDDVKEMREIHSLRDLLASILFHLREGTGCGQIIDDDRITKEYAQDTHYTVRLGGTNVRAALAIASAGEPSLIHLVSINEDTLINLPEHVEWICSDEIARCFPHIVIQFPEGARVRAGDIDCRAPRANRVIYSADTACATLKIAPSFFERAAQCRILVLSGFDLVRRRDVLDARLEAVAAGLDHIDRERTLVYYEDACFANLALARAVRERLRGRISIYSMNEDEFQTLAEKPIDLLDTGQVLEGLRSVAFALGGCTILVHTRHWALLYGAGCARYRPALEGGMIMATARYQHGDGATPERCAQTRLLKRQAEAVAFAGRLCSACAGIVCLPAFDVPTKDVTTVGLGDSFVGGFALAYANELRD